ncbi:MAG: NAD-glutamate dehydrogenase [Gammaproteobacteria bacterium]|nr:NAD-glutamate dehydrogenase [Gammaproteobacteria bacterium]
MKSKRGLQLKRQLVEEFTERYSAGFSESDSEQIRSLLNIYYRNVSPDDLEGKGSQDLIGATVAHWQLLRERSGSQPEVRVYNPNFEEHGWQSPHTIVETVCDDMSFLVDSISMCLNQNGLTIDLTIHPVIAAVRDAEGRLEAILENPVGGKAESLICFQVEKQLSQKVLDALREDVLSVIRNVTLANLDWQKMRQRTLEMSIAATDTRLPVAPEELQEARAFLDWVARDHFTFLACCELDLQREENRVHFAVDHDSLLGLFRETAEGGLQPDSVIPLVDHQVAGITSHLIVTKANARSMVHRPAYMDCIVIKRYDGNGDLSGLSCILGLFSIAAYSSPPEDIPLLRKKVAEVSSDARLTPKSYSGKVLHNILVTYPRDDLFQIPADELSEISLGILSLQERQRTRVFLFRDLFHRFYSCLVYVPREQYNRELRLRIQQVLVDALQGTEVEFTTQFSESILARVQYIVYTDPGERPEVDQEQLETQVVAATRTWDDELREALLERFGEAAAARHYKVYYPALPQGYIEDSYPRTAAADIARLEKARVDGALQLHFYRPVVGADDRVHLRLYSPEGAVPLSEAIPILENMGLSVFGERPYQIRCEQSELWIHDFSMRYTKAARNLDDRTSERFQETFLKVWQGEVDSDRFNGLVLDAGLSWRQVNMLRAYGRYLQQIKTPYSQSYIIDSLAFNPAITELLVEIFNLRFDPTISSRDKKLNRVLSKFDGLLESVSSLDQDRILRNLLNLILSTLRTNYFQTRQDGSSADHISFKFNPKQVNDMPLPRPMFEIFVFSSRMEGVHLRGGRVARGGLRWSDRMEDFRTEVLGLMKAQTVKNTVIVPVGSKGGFIVKRLPAAGDKDRMMDEVINCYRTFLRGMLDLTDNLVDGKVAPPSQVIRYDEDDPYLVIAADKGTATFSDIANGVAREYGFWLGDAFASGGSAGYDHKKMGITAKGAWESVKRNFRELGIDIQTTDFKVVGIGDMSGDVFGNGMLLSRHIKLVGAFNHMHIFLDPNPDPEVSFKERERLFNLPRSSWSDYDKSLISGGGGIYARSLKSIPLSEEVKGLLGVKRDRMPPNELISYLLKAQVDLLWNGGIGTYVKAEGETHDDVRDKANDGVRINGSELRCKVVGEGGNLGVTQLGRIEFAGRGGLIYTDAIDNSAGVDCSDHEVNIKILLNQIVANGEMTEKQRNRLLEEMTDEVAELVLSDNYAQTLAVSMVASVAPESLYEHARFIDHLEQRGRLNRELEFLPGNKAIAERQAQNKGLTKPEISVLHAYSKMNYYDALIESDVPDDEYLQSELVSYFPKVLGERFGKEMVFHRLRREIIATHLTNNIVDHVGPGFGFRVREQVGATIAGVTRAYAAVSKIFNIDELWWQIQQLDNRVAASVQMEMMLRVTQLLQQAVIWILRFRESDEGIRSLVDYFQQGVSELGVRMPKPLASKDRLALNRQTKSLAAAGVPRDLAQRVGIVVPMAAALDIVDVARSQDRDVIQVASVYYSVGMILDLHWIRRQIRDLRVHTHWHNLAKARLTDRLNSHQREITAQILKCARLSKVSRKMVDQWVDGNRFPVERHGETMAEFRGKTSLDFPMLSVLVDGLEAMAGVNG